MFPFKKKYYFLECFLGFQIKVEKQLERKIVVFQSDGGGEFTRTPFLTHLTIKVFNTIFHVLIHHSKMVLLNGSTDILSSSD